MPKHGRQERFILILILGLLTAIGPLSIDMYLPAFKDIAEGFNTDSSQVSLSLSSFFAGLAIGQLIYGPLLERFGRKKPMYAGMVIYIAASLGCAMASSIHMLIGLRFLQAVGSCSGLVAGRAIVRDLFDNREVARVFSMLMMVVAVSPVIAPTLGSFISATLSWNYIFILLAFLALLILTGTVFLIPESREPNRFYSLKPVPILKNYRHVLSNTQFLIYAFSGAIAYAGIYAYLSGSPHLYLEMFGVSQHQYGFIFAFIAAGLIGASQVNSQVLKKRSGEKLIVIALSIQCLISLALLADAVIGPSNLYVTTLLIFSYLFCLGFVFPNASAEALSTLGHTAGNASALLGSVQMTVGAIASAMVGIWQAEGAMPMVVVMSCCAVLALILLQTGVRTAARSGPA